MNTQNMNTQQIAPMATNELIQSASKLENLPAQSVQRMQSLVISLHTLEMCRSLAHHFCSTEMVPKQFREKPEDGAVAIMWGNEIGLDPLQSLQNVSVVNGTPSLWGDALTAIVKGSGQCEYLTSTFDDSTMTATVKTKRVNEPEEIRSYSMDDAKKAGLATKDTYMKHPKRMLQARARSHLLNDVYPDLLKGIKIREVMEEDGPRKEVDVTPRGSTLGGILNKNRTNVPVEKIVEKQSETLDAAPQGAMEQSHGEKVTLQKEVVQSEESSYKQDSTKKLAEYISAFEKADQEQLNAIGIEIREDTILVGDDKQQLREAYMDALGKFQR